MSTLVEFRGPIRDAIPQIIVLLSDNNGEARREAAGSLAQLSEQGRNLMFISGVTNEDCSRVSRMH